MAPQLGHEEESIIAQTIGATCCDVRFREFVQRLIKKDGERRVGIIMAIRIYRYMSLAYFLTQACCVLLMNCFNTTVSTNGASAFSVMDLYPSFM